MNDGISQLEFLRIFLTVTTALGVYLPLSVDGFVLGISRPRHRYSFIEIYDPQWSIIVKRAELPSEWGAHIGPLLAFHLFGLMGVTKTASRPFDRVIEWICDRMPRNLQPRWMRKTSAKCKKSRLALELLP